MLDRSESTPTLSKRSAAKRLEAPWRVVRRKTTIMPPQLQRPARAAFFSRQNGSAVQSGCVSQIECSAKAEPTELARTLEYFGCMKP